MLTTILLTLGGSIFSYYSIIKLIEIENNENEQMINEKYKSLYCRICSNDMNKTCYEKDCNNYGRFY